MHRPTAPPPLRRALLATLLLAPLAQAFGQDLPEYRLKAAFLYNFAAFTEWPSELGPTLTVCVHGPDPFGAELGALDGRKVGARQLAVQRAPGQGGLKACQIVFLAAGGEPIGRTLETLRGLPLLTVADQPGAMHQGVIFNLAVQEGRVSFEVNLRAARAAGLDISSRLLRLATEVRQ